MKFTVNFAAPNYIVVTWIDLDGDEILEHYKTNEEAFNRIQDFFTADTQGFEIEKIHKKEAVRF